MGPLGDQPGADDSRWQSRPSGPLTGPNYRIEANVGQIRGSNLFHSFGQFHVRTDESATFAGPNTITNVVGRVTGGEPSSINGKLRSEIPTIFS